MPSESSQFINPCIVQGDIWEEITQEIKEQVLDKIENTKIIYQKTKTPTNNIKILKLMFNQKVSKKKKILLLHDWPSCKPGTETWTSEKHHGLVVVFQAQISMKPLWK